MSIQPKSLYEALYIVYSFTGPSLTYLLLRQAVRSLTEEQVKEINKLIHEENTDEV